MKIQDIAKVCHQANKAYCESLGDMSQKDWADAEQWQRDSAIKGVEFRLHNLDASSSVQHEAWLKEKQEQGWKYGPVKDVNKKEHPCFVDYGELPKEQKAKDDLFKMIVLSLCKYLG